VREVWITGIGLVSSLGEGLDAHWRALAETARPQAVVDRETMRPFAIHPLVKLDLDKQIPRRADQRQMEDWQRVGTYAAGLALDDAGVAGKPELLARTHAIIAGDGGERDYAADGAILDGVRHAKAPGATLNERLAADLRPTLFLAQLPNLLAGNISIVHKVTGSSRTFMGEDIAGVSAVEIAFRRIAASQGDIFLVGAAYLAERRDTGLNYVLGGLMWPGEPIAVWERPAKGGGFLFGSAGAFLVLEARDHAEGRGRKPYARLDAVLSDQSRRDPGDVARTLERLLDKVLPADGTMVPLLSGASGVAAATQEEHDLLGRLIGAKRVATVRAMATILGSLSSAMFPALTSLAALALSRRGFYGRLDGGALERPLTATPGGIAITTVGIWRGEGVGLVSALG
jgi:3-oxoacyl-[acyl-carrier-protein] synthase II